MTAIIVFLSIVFLVVVAGVIWYMVSGSGIKFPGTKVSKADVFAKEVRNGVGEVKWTPYNPLNPEKRVYRHREQYNWLKPDRAFGDTGYVLFSDKEEAESLGREAYEKLLAKVEMEKKNTWKEI